MLIIRDVYFSDYDDYGNEKLFSVTQRSFADGDSDAAGTAAAGLGAAGLASAGLALHGRKSKIAEASSQSVLAKAKELGLGMNKKGDKIMIGKKAYTPAEYISLAEASKNAKGIGVTVDKSLAKKAKSNAKALRTAATSGAKAWKKANPIIGKGNLKKALIPVGIGLGAAGVYGAAKAARRNSDIEE